MTELELRELINKGEGHHLEFKEEQENNDDFAKTIAAFANTDGGRILVGISDDGSIRGINDIDSLMRRLDDIAINRCEPPITILQESLQVDGNNVVIVSVPKGQQRPYDVSGRTYIRSSNRIRMASREEKQRLFQSSESIYYDEIPVSRSKFGDFDINSFQRFLSDYLSLQTDDEKEIMYYARNLHLINEDMTPTVTGILFFGKNPQNFLTQARIICAAIEGNDIAIPPSDRKEINSTISKMIADSESFLKMHLTQKHEIKDFEKEVKEEIPFTALREALVNAIAHRDYTINQAIRVLVYSDRVEIRSPGILPNTVTVDSMRVGGSHVLRNPTIYNMLLKFKMVTDLGSGVRRIIKLVKEHQGKDVLLVPTSSEFIVTIPRAS